MPNIVELTTADHRSVEALFERFDLMNEGAVASAIFRLLSSHAEVEDHVLYPAIAATPAMASAAQELEADHSHVKSLICRARQSEGSALVALMAELRTAVAEHVGREEDEVLPAFEKEHSTFALDALGAQMLQVKQRPG